MTNTSRRHFLHLAGTALPCMASLAAIHANESSQQPNVFRYALNSGTLIGFKLSIEEEIDLAASAGYDAIEPWIRGLQQYIEKGGNLSDLKKRIEDHGLCVAGSCAFFQWVVDDDDARNKGIEQMKREMDMLRQIGGDRIAATAAGATGKRLDDFAVLGQRYRTILKIGKQMGVIPQLEVWGASQTMSCLADVAAIAIHAGHPNAELLLDVYHLYRGGSSFDGLAMLNGNCMTNFHLNDYPADPPREKAQDKDRIYPGDGIAPISQILDIFRKIGFNGFLSFEVFNPTYWESGNPLNVAKTGLKKMKFLVEMDTMQ